MTKPKAKKTCEFEAMRDVAEILAPFSIDERERIVLGVVAKLDAIPVPAKRGRKPKGLVVGAVGGTSANGRDLGEHIK